MNKIIGYCRFCGNPMMVMANDEMTDEDLNNQASLECDCEGARAERDIQHLIKTGEHSLKMIIAKKSQKTADALLPFVEFIARGKIKKISINFDGITTASMYTASSGKKIAVETRETVVEYSDGETVEMLPPDEDGGRTEHE